MPDPKDLPKAQPTQEQFAAFQSMYAYFNRVLFADELPEVILNFSRQAHTYGFFAPERWRREKMETKFDLVTGITASFEAAHEISINPSHLALRDPKDTAATLVHEMCHLWQQEFGTPSRRGYHDKQWAAKMVEVGLIPIDPNTGAERRSAHKLTHRIQEGGRFDVAYGAMPPGYLLPWRCREVSALDLLTRLRGLGAGPEAGPNLPGGEEEPGGEGQGGAAGEGEAGRPTAGALGLVELPKSRNKAKYSCPGCHTNVWGKPGLNLICGDCQEPFVSADEAAHAEAA